MEKGLAEGIEKGLAEGIEKGLAEGMDGLVINVCCIFLYKGELNMAVYSHMVLPDSLFC